MAIVYECRHCRQEIGQLPDSNMEANALGFQALTPEERLEMISYEPNGSLRVKSICEDCQEALERNPLFHQLDPFIQ